jgi:hypothetical protein
MYRRAAQQELEVAVRQRAARESHDRLRAKGCMASLLSLVIKGRATSRTFD